jgi:hypothetical protein
VFGIPAQIRRNCDNVCLLAGMTDKIMLQIGLNGRDWW